MIISAAAAARLFLEIATLSIPAGEKCSLMKKVSDIVEHRVDLGDAVFCGETEEQIRASLEKAIGRSAKARAAARRRRESVKRSEKPDDIKSVSRDPMDNSETTIRAEDNVEETVTVPSPVSEVETTLIAPGSGQPKKKRRGKRCHRRR